MKEFWKDTQETSKSYNLTGDACEKEQSEKIKTG